MPDEETQTEETPDGTPDAGAGEQDDGTVAPADDGGDANAGSEGQDTAVAAPASTPTPGGSPGGGEGGTSNVSATPVDLDAELNAKDLLIDKFAAGLITAEDYAAETAKIDKKILKAQRELAKPAQQVQQTIKEQEAARTYWQNWGKGADVAQKQFGTTIRGDRAAALFREAAAEVAANPRYQGRAEIDANSIAYDRWMDKMEAEAKKKPAAPAAGKTQQTRVTGNVPVSQSGSGEPPLTAREKLDRGMYNLG